MDIAGITDEKETKIVPKDYDNSKMSREDFLKVLLAEVQWQDPFNVGDMADFINNALKLREMEMLDAFEKSVESLTKTSSINTLLFSSPLIGKNIKYEGDITFVQNGKGYFEFKPEAEADLVKVYVVDDEDNIVDTSVFRNIKKNEFFPVEIENSTLKDGYYKIAIDAYQGENKIKSVIRSIIPVEKIEKTADGINIISGKLSIEIKKLIGVEG